MPYVIFAFHNTRKELISILYNLKNNNKKFSTFVN